MTTMATPLATWAIHLATLVIHPATLVIHPATLDIQVYLATMGIPAIRLATLVVILEVIQATVCWRTAC